MMRRFLSSVVPASVDNRFEDEPNAAEESSTTSSARHRHQGSLKRKITFDSSDDESSLAPSLTRHNPSSRKRNRIVSARTRSDGTNKNGRSSKSLSSQPRLKGRQFRILYSDYECKDATTKTMIPRHTLCVQCHEDTWEFMAWRLPSAQPVLRLDNALHPMAKMLIFWFLEEAQVGASPLEFYSESSYEVICILSRAPDSIIQKHPPSNDLASVPGGSKTKKLQEQDEESEDGDCNAFDDDDTPIISKQSGAVEDIGETLSNIKKLQEEEESEDDDDDDCNAFDPVDTPVLFTKNDTIKDVTAVSSITNGLREEEESEDGDCISFDDEDTRALSGNRGTIKDADKPVDAKNSDAPLVGKRPFWWSAPSARKKCKVYGGSSTKNQLPASTTFRVSNCPDKQFFVLVEGLVESDTATTGDIFMDRDTDSLPRKGRLIELLPTEATPGDWSASLVGPDGSATHVPGLLRNNGRELRGIRICLRHEDFHELGLLSETKSMNAGDKQSRRQVHVSAVDPSISRTDDFLRQGALSEADEHPVVGSISIAVCDGFTSFSDASSAVAGELASIILEAAHDGVVAKCEGAIPSIGSLEKLLPIPSKWDADDNEKGSMNLGVSFLCKLDATESYKILVAQDEEGRTIAADVMLGPSSRFSTSTASTCSVSQRPQLTAANIQRLGVEKQAVILPDRKDSVGEAEEDSSSIDGSKSSSESAFGGEAFDDEHHPTVDTLKPPAVTSASQYGTLNGTSTAPHSTTLAAQSKFVVSSSAPATVTPVVPRTERKAQKIPLLSPTIVPRAALTYVTPHVGRAGTSIRRTSGEEFSDPWDSDDSHFGSQNENHVTNSTRQTTEEEVGGAAEDQAPLEEGRQVARASTLRKLYTHKHAWGKMGLAFFLVIMLTQLEMSSRLRETVRSESRDAMMSFDNSTFHELLTKTEKVLSARRGFSVVGGDWVSVIAIVVVAVTFGGV